MPDWRYYYHSYLPETWRMTILARRRIPIFKSQGVGFIHVAKAAGSSICDSLYGGFMGHFSARELNHASWPGGLNVPMFSVVRNPWDRLLSAYSYTVQGGGSGGNITANVFRPERYAIPEFENFERFVNEWLPNQSLDQLDPVFKTQSHFLCDSTGEIMPDFVGKLENLHETTEWLTSQLDRDITISKGNESKRSGHYRDHYNQKMADIVAEKYGDDIAKFDYQF